MSPRTDVSEERRQQILDAATSVFSRLGFHKARMDDIVEESGLSKGALYWYFKSKDDIILAILDNLFKHDLSNLQSFVQDASDDSSASDLLRNFAQSALVDIKRMLRLMPLTYEFYALAFRNKAVRQALKSYLRTYLDILTPIIQRGIDQGEFRKVDAKEAAIIIGASMEGILLLYIYDSEMVNLDQHFTSAVELYLQSLQPDTKA